MKCPVVDLAVWKSEHNPVVKIAEANNRIMVEWCLAWWRVWLR